MGLIIWNICLTIMVLILMVALGRLIELVEAIKSWCPFCKLSRDKIKGWKGE